VTASEPATEEDLVRAADRLRAGGLVAFPTETVYGLGADATNPAAVARVYRAKGRPPDHPLIVHLASADEMGRWAATVSTPAARLAAALWPGPLTLVVRRSDALPAAATGGRDTVGLRVPDHPLASRLLELAGVPVAAPSANRFGRVSATSAADVRAELGDAVDLVIDGGTCRIGVESTIVEVLDDGPATLLRPGGVPVELIEEVLGSPLRAPSGPARASGMLPSHYAPRCRVELVADERLAERASELRASGLRVTVLAAPSSVATYARTLYRRLREADDAGADVLLAVAPPPEGLGLAVVDRLRRAAAPRA
jgi:L-threonylcarbamoyladenylate synthase